MKTKRKLVSAVLIAVLLFSAFIMAIPTASAEESQGRYEAQFAEYLSTFYNEGKEPDGSFSYYYRELYDYYETDPTSAEATPDSILINGHLMYIHPWVAYGIFGRYIIVGGGFAPYEFGYYVYTPENGKFYTLAEAWNNEIPGVEEMLPKIPHIHLMGDVDEDGDLTVKDATKIQKWLAGMITDNSNFRPNAGANFCPEYDPHIGPDGGFIIADIDRSSETTIKDATLVQKYVAKVI